MSVECLRERIATTLDGHSLKFDNSAGDWVCYCGMEGTSASERHDEHVADAVIAELGLYEEIEDSWRGLRRHFVTDWESL